MGHLCRFWRAKMPSLDHSILERVESLGQAAPPRQKNAFTLIEVLIVVVIVAVLAGATIPKFLGVADDAKESSLNHNLHVLEAQIGLYRQHHAGYPTVQGDALPQLTSATNSAGKTGPSGADYPFGPYLLESPMNPYDGSTKVTPVQLSGKRPTAVVGKLGGWQYDKDTGAIWPNHAEYYK